MLPGSDCGWARRTLLAKYSRAGFDDEIVNKEGKGLGQVCRNSGRVMSVAGFSC